MFEMIFFLKMKIETGLTTQHFMFENILLSKSFFKTIYLETLFFWVVFSKKHVLVTIFKLMLACNILISQFITFFIIICRFYISHLFILFNFFFIIICKSYMNHLLILLKFYFSSVIFLVKN